MLRTKMELIFLKEEPWNDRWPNSYPSHSFVPVFAFGNYSPPGYIEKNDDKDFIYNTHYEVTVDFPLIVTNDLEIVSWNKVRDEIFIDMTFDIKFGSRTLGKAKLLDYKYDEEYKFYDSDLRK